MQKTHVDLLLTKWLMPELDGVGLVRKLREHPAYADVPIILFTVRTERDEVEVALAAGIDSYLAKPFSHHQLREKIDTVLEDRSTSLVRRLFEGSEVIDADDKHPSSSSVNRRFDLPTCDNRSISQSSTT